MLTPIYDRAPTSKTGRGLVTLVGDAAHPMTPTLGQGACLAIEDAVVLVRHIRQQDELEASLRMFEQECYRRTALMVSQSKHLGNMIHWRWSLSPTSLPTDFADLRATMSVFDAITLKSLLAKRR